MTRRSLLVVACLTGSAFAATIPRRAPEFVVRSVGGEVLLSQFRGKVILLAFLFST